MHPRRQDDFWHRNSTWATTVIQPRGPLHATAPISMPVETVPEKSAAGSAGEPVVCALLESPMLLLASVFMPVPNSMTPATGRDRAMMLMAVWHPIFGIGGTSVRRLAPTRLYRKGRPFLEFACRLGSASPIARRRVLPSPGSLCMLGWGRVHRSELRARLRAPSFPWWRRDVQCRGSALWCPGAGCGCGGGSREAVP